MGRNSCINHKDIYISPQNFITNFSQNWPCTFKKSEMISLLHVSWYWLISFFVRDTFLYWHTDKQNCIKPVPPTSGRTSDISELPSSFNFFFPSELTSFLGDFVGVCGTKETMNKTLMKRTIKLQPWWFHHLLYTKIQNHFKSIQSQCNSI